VRYEAAAAPAKPARPRLSAPQDDASALGYAPPKDSVTTCLEGSAPVRYEAAAAPAKPARPRLSAPQDGASALGYPTAGRRNHLSRRVGAGAARSGGRTGKAGTASIVGAARRRLSTWLRPTASPGEPSRPPTKSSRA